MRAALWERYRTTREATERLAAPLSAEDQLLQAMPDASPTKWHRAHTTWFFETFVLAPAGVAPVDPRWGFLFNSYYESIGPRHARHQRGLLSRPSLDEVAAWRRTVDARVGELLERLDDRGLERLGPVLELGIAHEEQHQELILTDVLAAFAQHPLGPSYVPEPASPTTAPASAERTRFEEHAGGLVELGTSGGGFAFDNEGPRHKRWVEPFALSTELVTVGELKAFIAADGYGTPALWLSEGWDWVQKNRVQAPGYARLEGDALVVSTLHGPRAAHDAEPASHLSFYEADALARFLGGRLPTEAEWEMAAAREPQATTASAVYRERGAYVPSAPPAGGGSLFGNVWQWTRSSYEPYPGFQAGPGAIGEYNGKFMVGQLVLRGGSCLTNRAHMRATYRNFWPAQTRFQMTGARVARDLGARR